MEEIKGIAQITVAVMLVVNILMAYYFGKVGEMKGHTGCRLYVLPFLCGISGMLYIIALPDRNKPNVVVEMPKNASAASSAYSQQNYVSNDLPSMR